MITKIIEIRGEDHRICDNGDVERVAEYYGKSTDAKPVDAANADRFIEMDTGKVFLFDEDSETWLELKQ